MKPDFLHPITRTATTLCTAALLATTAWAGGTHSDGHHAASPVGVPGQADQVTRTIAVDATDQMRFTPARVVVKKGETIRFVITNSGQLPHEFSLGSQQELLEHYEVMKKFPDMEHDEPNKVSLKPGQRGEVVWRFTHTGVVHFACLHVGHYDAGMEGQVKVVAK